VNRFQLSYTNVVFLCEDILRYTAVRWIVFFNFAGACESLRCFVPEIETAFSSTSFLGGVFACGSCCVSPIVCVDDFAEAAIGLERTTPGLRHDSCKGGKYHFGSVAGAILSRAVTGVVVEAGNALGKENCAAGVYGSRFENNGATACCTA
jgi:hypothetical protein